MIDIPKYIRIFELQPTDDLVEKRTAAIKEVSLAIGKLKTISEICEHANVVTQAMAPKGALDPAFQESVATAIRKKSSAFSAKGHAQELLVCSWLSVLHLIDSAKTSSSARAVADFYAAAMWSALSFQPHRKEAKLEELRSDLLVTSQKLVKGSAEMSRIRAKIPGFDFGSMGVDIGQLPVTLKKSTENTVNALRENALADREELDLLWYVVGDWSDLLQCRISEMKPELAAVNSGLEVGRSLRALPADAHLNIAMRNVGKGEELSLVDLLKMGDNRLKLTEGLNADVINKSPLVFPLLAGLINGKSTIPGSTINRSVRDWAGRAMLEVNLCEATYARKDV